MSGRMFDRMLESKSFPFLFLQVAAIVYFLVAMGHFLQSAWFVALFGATGGDNGFTAAKGMLLSVIFFAPALLFQLLALLVLRLKEDEKFTAKYPMLTGILLSITVGAFFILLIEASAWFVVCFNKGPEVIRNYTFRFGDFRIPLPNTTVHDYCAVENLTIYDVNYTINQYGLRLTPDSPDDKTYDEFLMIWGCSFTFGIGVKDEETMPNQVAKKLPSAHVYNFGVGGHGPHHMLARMEQGDCFKGVKEKKGVLIYTFNAAQLERVLGAKSVVTTFGASAPCYKLDYNGVLQYRGPFITARPYMLALYDLMRFEYVHQALKMEIPPFVTESDIKLVTEIFKESKKIFEKRYPDSRFLVMLYPIQPKLPQRIEALKAELEAVGIQVLDYRPSLAPILDSSAFFPYDHHPLPKTNTMIADEIVNDLYPDRKVSKEY